MSNLKNTATNKVGRAVYLIEVLLDEMLKANPEMRLSSIKKEAEEFCQQHNDEWHIYFRQRLQHLKEDNHD